MRELASDFTLITREDPDVVNHSAWSHFMVAMKGRAYGYDALWNAWYWFRDGWVAREAEGDR